MKRVVLSIPAALAMAGGIVLAHAADDPLAQLRACSLMERTKRLECLDRLSRAVVSPARPAPGDWIISQTTSPVDYTAIATATTSSRGPAGSAAMQLSIRCRGGRTELTVVGPAISGRSEDYSITYRVDGRQPVQIAAGAPAFGAGVAIKGDPVPLLRSLPSEGELALHLSPRAGTAQDGVFSLVGLEAVRTKMEAACKWPHAVAKPNFWS